MLQYAIRALLTATFVVAVHVPLARAASAQCDNRNNDTVAKLLECVTLEGVRAHQAALQAIVDDNGGHRFGASQGYVESVDYVVGRLEAAQDVERVVDWFTTDGGAPSWVPARKGAPKGSFIARWPDMPEPLVGRAFRGRTLLTRHAGAWSPDRVERAVTAAGLRAPAV